MAECCPLRLLFKQHPKQLLANDCILQVSHCKSDAVRFGRGTHQIYLEEPYFIIGFLQCTRYGVVDVWLGRS